MLFNSYAYLIYFLPVAALGFFFFGARAHWAVRWLVVASLFFYGWWNPAHLPLIVASIAGNFWFASRIERGNRHRWLVTGVTANLALLGVFKYSDFILRTLAGSGGIVMVRAAQAAAPQAEPSADMAAADEAADPIVVTGSRVDRKGFQAPTPVTVLGQAEIRQGDRTNIALLLNDQPAFRATTTPTTTPANTNSGTSIVDERPTGT